MKTRTIQKPAAERDEVPFNAKHELFIREMAKHGNKTRAYQAAYPGITRQSARASASRLLANDEMQSRLRKEYEAIHLGSRKDKEAFIYQESKLIEEKRKYLLNIMQHNNEYKPSEVMKAIKLDNELADKHAQLLGYGGFKQCAEFSADAYEQWELEEQVAKLEAEHNTTTGNEEEPAIEKNAESVTFCNTAQQPDSKKPDTLLIPIINHRPAGPALPNNNIPIREIQLKNMQKRAKPNN